MTSFPQQKKTIIDPDLSEVLAIAKQDIFASMNCVKVGRIQTFDATKHTAQVQILFKRVLSDLTIRSYPLLVDVPVVTIQGGGAALQVPIAAGDQCLLFFSDRRIDEWYQNGGESAPGDPRMHDLSDGFALVGVNALNSSLPATPTNKAILSYSGSQVEIDASALKLICTGSAEIDLDSKVTIKNGTTTLLTLMQNFITLLEALTIQDDEGGAILPLTAASIAALEAFKAQFATLLG